MKIIKYLMLICIGAFFVAYSAVGQVANPTIQVIGLGTTNPTNSGEVAIGATLDLLVTIGNTGAASITANRVRPRITLPPIVELLPDAQQSLPAGWSIIGTSTTQIINICNGTDIIPVNGVRNIIIKVKGVSLGSVQTFSGQLFFGGTGSCTTTGPAQNSTTNDDFATSSLTVIAAPVPLTLISFSALLNNCEPVLKWVTESEINTDRFEIERSSANASVFTMIGSLSATGSGATKSNYSFADNNIVTSTEKIFYRLKMIDKDGKFKYSEILPINVNCKITSVSVYPNPIKNGKLYVSVTGLKNNTQATLLSVAGQYILQTKVNNGTNFINVSTLANGVYILNMVEEKGLTKRVKVVIQN